MSLDTNLGTTVLGFFSLSGKFGLGSPITYVASDQKQLFQCVHSKFGGFGGVTPPFRFLLTLYDMTWHNGS